jgi:flap endonuclease-1
VWATASQDYDSLLFGAPKLVKNLAITGKRKLPRKNIYIEVNPELIELGSVLGELGVTLEQLIEIGIMVGTDFNPDGVRGVGAKTALKLVKEHGTIEKVKDQLQEKGLPENISAIKQIFQNPSVTNDYKIEWKYPNIEGTVKFLCDERDFSEERVRNALNKIVKSYQESQMKQTLDKWFS